MKISIRIAVTLALAFLGLFGTANANGASGPQLSASATEFPQSVEVIPGKLKVKIFLHEIKYKNETISCWSFVTDGLVSQKQKEIIFTLRRDNNQKPSDYPRQFLDLFRIIFQYAEKGQIVDVGDATIFSEAGFPGYKDFRGIGYVEPEGFPGVETGRVPLLAGIALLDDEAQIARQRGLTRIIALLGQKYRYYPCPTWSDLKREPVATMQAMENSPFQKVPAVGVHASYYKEQNHLFLSLSPSSRVLLEPLGKMPLSAAVVLLTQPDPRANACLVWQAVNDHPTAITAPNSDGSRVTGAFLAFVPQQNANDLKIGEDGIAVFLTDSAWQKVRDALVSGSNASVPPAGVAGASISVAWRKEGPYTSPATGETYPAREWNTYLPRNTSTPPKQRAAITSSYIVLLTSDRDIEAHTTVADMGGYLNAIADAVDAFFASPERRTSRELVIHLALTVEGHQVRMVAKPELTSDVFQALQKQIESLPAPKVKGPVELDFILTVWDVKPIS